MKHLTVVRNHLIYFDEVGYSYFVSEIADESGKLYYVRSRSGALHYNEVMGELLGNTFAEAVQGLVKQLVLLRDESVMSMTPEFKEAINKLEEKYLK